MRTLSSRIALVTLLSLVSATCAFGDPALTLSEGRVTVVMSAGLDPLGSAIIRFIAGDIPGGAIAHYSFDNPTDIGHDDSGNGRQATPVGDPTYVAGGRLNAALEFHGADGLNVANGPDFLKGVATSRTVAFWMNQSDPTGDQLLYDEGGESAGIGIGVHGGVLQARVKAGPAVADILAAKALTPGWHHVAAVFGDSALKLYLDNEALGTVSAFVQIPQHSDDPGIGYPNGQATLAASGFYKGLLDEVCIWDRALTAGETSRLFDPASASGELVLSSADGSDIVLDNTVIVDADGTLTAGRFDSGVAGPVTVTLNNLTLNRVLTLNALDDYRFALPQALTSPGGIKAIAGEVEIQKPLDLAVLDLVGGRLSRVGTGTDRNITVRQRLTLASDSLDMPGQDMLTGDKLTLTDQTEVTIGAGQSLTMAGPFDAASLDLSGTLTLTGVDRDVALGRSLTLSGADLDMTGSNLDLSTAAVTIGRGRTLTYDKSLSVRELNLSRGRVDLSAAPPGRCVTASDQFVLGDTTVEFDLKGAAGLTVQNATPEGLVVLKGSNTFSGQVQIVQGALQVPLANLATGNLQFSGLPGSTDPPPPPLTTLETIVGTDSNWVENFGLHAQMPYASVVVGNYLFANGRKPETLGVIAFDGRNVRLGGKTADLTEKLWTDGTRLYAYRETTRVTAAYSTKTGTFTQGELVTEGTTGATGWFIRDTGSELIIQLKEKSPPFASGSGTGSYTITGRTSGKTAQVRAVKTDVSGFLELSPDGFSDFRPVQDIPDKMYPRSFVDCGQIGGRQLLLALTVRFNSSDANQIWYNYPAEGSTWHLLMETTPNAIRHFHGAVMIRGVDGGSANRLVVMTGDSNDEPSIVFCDDVADLIAHPDVWKTRWALDKVGQARRDYLTTGPGAKYCFGVGDQLYRTVDFIVDANKRYAYYLPDDAANPNGVPLVRVDLTTGQVTHSGSTRTIGEGSIGTLLSNGTIVITTFAGENWGGNADDYLRLYMVAADGQNIKELWARKLQKHATSWFSTILEYPVAKANSTEPAVLWVAGGANSDRLPKGEAIVGLVAPAGQQSPLTLPQSTVNVLQWPPVNLIKNGRFRFGWSEAVGGGSPTSLTNWVTTNANVTREISVVDTLGGNDVALKVTPTGSGGAYALYRLPLDVLDSVRGHWITLTCRVLWNADNQTATILWYDGVQSTSPTYLSKSPSWQTLQFQTLVPPNAIVGNVRLYARTSGSGTTPVYFSDVSLVRGALEGLLPASLPVSRDFVAVPEAVLMTCGVFEREIGDGPGQVQWQGHGGFAAQGGPLTVTLTPHGGSPGGKLIWRAADPTGATISKASTATSCSSTTPWPTTSSP
jgi:autotransporter-associated beta strand protein